MRARPASNSIIKHYWWFVLTHWERQMVRFTTKDNEESLNLKKKKHLMLHVFLDKWEVSRLVWSDTDLKWACDPCTDKYYCLLHVYNAFLNMTFFKSCSLRAGCLWRWSPAHSSKWIRCRRRWISRSTCSHVFINEASWVCGHAACGLNIVWGSDGINTVYVFWRGKQSHVSLFMLRCQV